MVKVLGYGAGDTPLNDGIKMAECPDMDYAKDTLDAYARKHIGQWFGLAYEQNKKPVFTAPVRLTWEKG